MLVLAFVPVFVSVLAFVPVFVLVLVLVFVLVFVFVFGCFRHLPFIYLSSRPLLPSTQSGTCPRPANQKPRICRLRQHGGAQHGGAVPQDIVL